MHPAKYTIDTVAAVGIVGTMVGWFPAVAAGLGILWYCIQIAESKSFERIVAWLKSKLKRT